MFHSLILLIFIYSTITTGQVTDKLSGLSQDVLQDIYDIYNGLPLATKKIQNITVTSDKIKFYLFSNNDTKSFTIINSANASVVKSNAPVVFLIHGWTQDRNTEWYKNFTEIFFLLNPQYNVIQVDYSPYSKIDYLTASSTISDVGHIIGKFVVTLIQDYLIPIDNILILGHSLGGQASSFVGKKAQELLNKKLPQIIAMDPAGPLFEQRPKSEKLNSNDATVVQVVHSNGGMFGYLKSCGTIDFFLNGGTIQPGCTKEALTNIREITSTVFCSHHMSLQVFTSAVKNQKHFKARKCSNWVTYSATPNLCSSDFVYLEDIKTNKIGNYYLNSTGSSPYYK